MAITIHRGISHRFLLAFLIPISRRIRFERRGTRLVGVTAFVEVTAPRGATGYACVQQVQMYLNAAIDFIRKTAGDLLGSSNCRHHWLLEEHWHSQWQSVLGGRGTRVDVVLGDDLQSLIF